MPMIWLMVVSMRELSVLLMPGELPVATAGVLKPPVADRQVFGGAKDFAERRETGKDLRAGIERVTLERIVMALQPANEQVVVLVERVVDAIHEIGSTKQCGRVPLVCRIVQTVAKGAV